MKTPVPPTPRRRGGAALVAAGIFLSRIVGFVRQRALARYLGLSPENDALTSAFRIPNLLQNLFGEGALSASFIPVYSRLLADGDEVEARRVAGAVAALLGAVVAVAVLVGVLGAPLLVGLIASGLKGATRELAVTLVRILFPGIGLLVLSAWCLGVLNSHRRFFLSYAAPVAWNLVQIATILAVGTRVAPARLTVWVAWAAVAGSLAQLVVQLPTVLRVAGRMRFAYDRTDAHVRTVVRNFAPTLMGRGVAQISAFVDNTLATNIAAGAAGALFNAQAIYLLPVSLFGMSVSAAELPEMSSATGTQEARQLAIRARLDGALRRLAVLVVPSAVAFIALGDVIAAALYQTGRFGVRESQWVWAILAGSAVGLYAATSGRLYSSTHYALGDTRTPLRFATFRIGVSLVLGVVLAFAAPRWLGIDPRWGAAGLALGSGIAAWVECLMLRESARSRVGGTGPSASWVAGLWAAAAIGAAAAWGARLVLPSVHPVVRAVLLCPLFAVVYLLAADRLGARPEVRALTGRIGGRFARRR